MGKTVSNYIANTELKLILNFAQKLVLLGHIESFMTWGTFSIPVLISKFMEKLLWGSFKKNWTMQFILPLNVFQDVIFTKYR